MAKKIVLILLVVSLSVSSLFAFNVKDDPTYQQALGAFFPSSPRSKAMGGVGIISVRKDDVFYLNPAVLADRQVSVSLPYITLGLYHPAALLSSGIFDSLTGFEMDSMINAVLPLLSAGQGKIFDIGAGVQVTAGGFGLSVDIKDSLLTYAPENTTGGVNSSIVDQLNAAITIGYGGRIGFGKSFSMDMGASVAFNYLVFNQAIDGERLLSIVKDGDFFGSLESIPIMAGFSVPITLGINFNLPLGFAIGTVLRNVNGFYYMKESSGLSDLPFGKGTMNSVYSDLTWDIGVGWTFDKFGKLFSPSIEVDLVDVASLFYEDYGGDLGRALLKRLKVGVELQTLYILDFWGGLNGGYWSFGLGIDFYAIRIDMAYYWEEFGSVSGEKGLDTFLVKINIGW